MCQIWYFENLQVLLLIPEVLKEIDIDSISLHVWHELCCCFCSRRLKRYYITSNIANANSIRYAIKQLISAQPQQEYYSDL